MMTDALGWAWVNEVIYGAEAQRRKIYGLLVRWGHMQGSRTEFVPASPAATAHTKQTYVFPALWGEMPMWLVRIATIYEGASLRLTNEDRLVDYADGVALLRSVGAWPTEKHTDAAATTHRSAYERIASDPPLA